MRSTYRRLQDKFGSRPKAGAQEDATQKEIDQNLKRIKQDKTAEELRVALGALNGQPFFEYLEGYNPEYQRFQTDIKMHTQNQPRFFSTMPSQPSQQPCEISRQYFNPRGPK